MKKLASLRQAVLASPLKIEAKDLLTFAEKGKLHSWRPSDDAGNQGFAAEYTAHLIVTDYGGAPQDLFFVVVDWLHRECPDAAEDAIAFHVDVIDQKKADVSLAIDITEVIATPAAAGGKVSIAPVAGPDAGKLDMGAFHPTLPAHPPE